MAASEADIGYGSTVTFASGFCAEITSISEDGPSRPAIKRTHMTSPDNRDEYMASDIVDEGTINVELQYIPGTDVPIDGAAETITITFPIPEGESAGATRVGAGFLTAFKSSIPLADKMTATATIQLTGLCTTTPSS